MEVSISWYLQVHNLIFVTSCGRLQVFIIYCVKCLSTYGTSKKSVAAATTEVLSYLRKDTARVVYLYLETVSLVCCVSFPEREACTEPTSPTLPSFLHTFFLSLGQAHPVVHHNYF